ncbi:response regulator [Chryseobacterium sp. A301]
MSIIVVEDNVEICSMIEEILREEGHKVRSCTNPMIVFEMIKQMKPKLIVTDMLMSGIDGREICRQLKSDSETSSIKILLMSAHPNSFALSEAVGADGHISKPFEIDEFATLVKQMLV